MRTNCKECAHYHGRCVLDDLEPCSFYSKDQKRSEDLFRIIVGIALAVTAAVIILSSCCRQQEDPAPAYQSAMELLRKQHHELSEWEELQMAIIWTESRFRTDAVGAAGDRGAMQIVPIYIDEVNRLAGTSYVPTDAFDVTKSLEMFEIIQGVYNPTHDRDLAIYYHNKGSSYRAEVLKNLELVHRYEVVRRAVKK